MKIFIILFFLLSCNLHAKVLAKVADVEITQKYLERYKKQFQVMDNLVHDDSYYLDKLINYELAVYDAKKAGADKTSDGQRAMDRGLYDYYVSRIVDTQVLSKKISPKELNNFYKKDPMIKMKRLCLSYDIKKRSNYEGVRSRLSILRSELINKKTTFEKASQELGDYVVPNCSGFFDKIYKSQFTIPEQAAMEKMKRNEFSPVLDVNNYLVLFQLDLVYSFQQVKQDELVGKYKMYLVEATRDKWYRSLRNKHKGIVKISQ